MGSVSYLNGSPGALLKEFIGLKDICIFSLSEKRFLTNAYM